MTNYRFYGKIVIAKLILRLLTEHTGGYNEKYTERHPVIMGSLSKVQVKENKNGIVDWDDIFTDTKSYMFKYMMMLNLEVNK